MTQKLHDVICQSPRLRKLLADNPKVAQDIIAIPWCEAEDILPPKEIHKLIMRWANDPSSVPPDGKIEITVYEQIKAAGDHAELKKSSDLYVGDDDE